MHLLVRSSVFKPPTENARTIQFEFTDVLFDSVDPLAVGKYLREAEIDVGNPVLDRYVLGKGQLFLITEVLKSASMTVKAERSDQSGLVLDVPVIEGIAGGKINLDTSHASTGVVTYKGNKVLAFGFKCFRVGIEDGVLDVSGAAPNDVALAAGLGAPEHVLGSSGLLEIDGGGLI